MNAKTTTWPLQNTNRVLKRLAASTVVAERSLWHWRSKVEVNLAEPGERYGVAVLQSLAVFRFVSFALGIRVVSRRLLPATVNFEPIIPIDLAVEPAHSPASGEHYVSPVIGFDTTQRGGICVGN